MKIHVKSHETTGAKATRDIVSRIKTARNTRNAKPILIYCTEQHKQNTSHLHGQFFEISICVLQNTRRTKKNKSTNSPFFSITKKNNRLFFSLWCVEENANEMRRCTHSRISRVTVDSTLHWSVCARVCVCHFALPSTEHGSA